MASSRTNQALNEKLLRYVPELNADFGKYPMTERVWINTRGKINDQPAFILSDSDAGIKRNYVWGPGPLGKGYYHLMTRNAYAILHVRLSHGGPPANCCAACCSSDARTQRDDWDDVKTICYNRSVASKPDDAQAKTDALNIARGVAQAHHNFNQDMQLVAHVVSAAY